MLRRILKNKKAQNTAEYAILISLVVAGIIAMQTYAQRALQARVRDASSYLATEADVSGDTTTQYEPYYLESSYDVNKNDTSTRKLGNQLDERREASNRTRLKDGYQVSKYDTSFGLNNGI